MFSISRRNASWTSGDCAHSHSNHGRTGGFTLIELMIVLAVVSILLSLALPVYSNYSVRSKISEGLSVAAGAKTATAVACQEDPTIADLDNAAAGYTPTTTIDSTYISTIEIDGPCSAPTITIVTRDTGAPAPDPVIVLTGDITIGSGRVTWTCASSNTPAHLLPQTCRS